MNTESELQQQDAPLGRLPFTFAKRNGVILTRSEEGDPIILVRPGASHSALAEANRVSVDSAAKKRSNIAHMTNSPILDLWGWC